MATTPMTRRSLSSRCRRDREVHKHRETALPQSRLRGVMLSHPQQYDPFANAYSQLWGSEFHSQIDVVLKQLFYSDLQPGATVLDLCCGSGHLTERLVARGYRAIGLDGSPEMIRHAHERVPKGEFFVADARSFRLPVPVDAVVSTFDSLNHVMTTDDLSQVFDSVRSALVPTGRFLFDLNHERVYQSLWARTGIVRGENITCITRGSYSVEHRHALCEITVRNDRAGTSSTFCLEQRCHDRAEVEALLGTAGFACVTSYDAATLGMQGHIAFDRRFYLAIT